MPKPFAPRLDILPRSQRLLWEELAAIPTEFTLCGGTAIALHLGHRQSVDFDFFGTRSFDPTELAKRISLLADATITQQERDTLTAIVDRQGPVKISFFGVPNIHYVAAPHISPENGLRVAALLDLAGMKASVVQQRAEAKDYIDIAAILSQSDIDLPTALASARVIYGPQFNPQITLKALSYFDDGNLRHLPEDTKNYLARVARDVDLDTLPSLITEIPLHDISGGQER